MQVTQLSDGRGWLNAPAAASLGRVDRAIGHPLQITEAGRSKAEQRAHYDRYMRYLRGGTWAPLAAAPGSSPHEFGNAIDTNERLVALLAAHGWSRPLKSEPWHFVYNPNNDRHRFDPAPAGQEEDDMFTDEDRKLLNTLAARMNDSVLPNFDVIKPLAAGTVERLDESVLPTLTVMRAQLDRIEAHVKRAAE